MTKAKIIQEIKEIEEALNSPHANELTKRVLSQRHDKLKADLESFEKESKKEEVKLVTKEKEIHENVQEKINKLKKQLSSPNLPEVSKVRIRKMIEDAEAELEKQKKEIVDEQQQAKKETEEIKEAVKEVEKKINSKPVKEKAAKKYKEKPAPAPRKETPIPVPKIKEKEREEKSKKRKSKISQILTDLEKLINKNKKLDFYKGSHVNLEIDAKRAAKPVGYRFRGKHDYRVPDAEQIKRGKKRGTVYFENRPEHSDRYPKGYRGKIKLAHGGSVDSERFAKPAGWRWKNSAVEDGIVSKAALSKSPSAAMRAKYPDYVAFEDRADKSDKHPSRRYRSLGEGGEVHHDKHLDGERTAKPQGWRWKDDAVHLGIIKKTALLKEPSIKMREEYPELVYQEKRLSKSDKNPSSKFISLEKGGKAKSGTTKGKKAATPHQQKMKEVIAHAKATRKEGEVWKMAVKRSWQEIG